MEIDINVLLEVIREKIGTEGANYVLSETQKRTLERKLKALELEKKEQEANKKLLEKEGE